MRTSAAGPGTSPSSWETPPSGRKRKYYSITKAGLAELAEQRRQWATVTEALKGIWHNGGGPRPVTAS